MSKKLNHIYACIDQDPNLKTANQKLVFQVFASFSKYFTKNVFMSPEQLYERKRISDSTAKRTLKYLQEIGYITLIQRGGASGREYRANLYQINMPEGYRSLMQPIAPMNIEDQIKYAKRTLAKSGVDLSLLDALIESRKLKSEKKRSLVQAKVRYGISKLIATK